LASYYSLQGDLDDPEIYLYLAGPAHSSFSLDFDHLIGDSTSLDLLDVYFTVAAFGLLSSDLSHDFDHFHHDLFSVDS